MENLASTSNQILILKLSLFDKIIVVFLNSADPYNIKNSTKRPKCDDEKSVRNTIGTNRDQILEWLLSDLWQFLPKRKNLIKLFRFLNNGKKFSL